MAKVDVIYPVYTDISNFDEKFFSRFRCSLESLERNRSLFSDFRVIISDSSPISLESVLTEKLSTKDYVYLYRPFSTRIRTGYGFFSKPHTMNIAVKELVTAPLVKISDIDIVYPVDHMQKVVDYMNSWGCITYAGRRVLEEYYSSDIDVLLTKSGEYLTTPGIPTIRTELFHLIRGYDENPEYAGLEDSDFLLRLEHTGRAAICQNWPGTLVAHLWHKKDWPANQHLKDREFFFERRDKLRAGKKVEVNQFGYGIGHLY